MLFYAVSVCRVPGRCWAEMSFSRVASGSRRPADRELWALRDEVLRLEEELAVNQAQLSKVTRQYNCLVELLHKYVYSSVSLLSVVCPCMYVVFVAYLLEST